MAKAKKAQPPAIQPKKKRGIGWKPVSLFIVISACVIFAAMLPKSTPTQSGTPQPTDTDAPTETNTATLTRLQFYQTATWDALTVIPSTLTQVAQDRADTATARYYQSTDVPLSTDAPFVKPTIVRAVATTIDGPLALCNDGTDWYGTDHRGACSKHKGVKAFYR